MMKNSQTKLVESFTLGVSQSEMNRIRQWYRNTVNISDIQTDQYGYEYVTLLFTKRKGSPSWRLSKFRGKINATSNTGGLQTFESFEDAVDTLNRRYGQEMASASDMKKIQKSTRESRLVESAIRKIANVIRENAEWDEYRVKDELPKIKAKLPNGKTVMASISGRRNEFATVHSDGYEAEFSWKTLARCLTNGTTIQL